ncbi:MAG: acyltransferase family protein [Lachnospiraceae bacterium]
MVSKRQSNLELLRIFCMISIIVGHILTQTQAGNLHVQDGFNYFLIMFLGNGLRLVINCFVMIGAWFLVDTDFKATRVVNLWLEIFFYSVILSTICLVFQIGDASLVWEVQAFFPIMGRPIWFGAEYICMLFLSPFMNRLLHNYRYLCKKLLIMLGLGILVCATIFPIDHTAPVFSELVWFCFLYMFIGYVKLNHINFIKHDYTCWIVAIGSWTGLWAIRVGADWMGNEFLIEIAKYYFGHYENLLSFVCSYCLFEAFRRLKIGIIPVINFFSGSVFSIYLIHQTRAFFPFLWNSIYHIDQYVYSKCFFGYILMVVVTLFVGCTLIDWGRNWLFQRTIYKSSCYKLVCRKIDEWLRI